MLKLDWATTESARYACENWHYTQYLPSASCKVGVWENDIFCGVVLFGIGAANATRGDKYGLARKGEVAELVRVALRDHSAPVSRIVKIAVVIMKKKNPGVRMVISFADPMQGHHGGIYQAGNWIYAGTSSGDRSFVVHGRVLHAKTIHSNKWRQQEQWLKDNVDPKAKIVKTPGKHRYLMPLDEEMRERIEPLRKPYPKRDKQAMADNQSAQRRGSTDRHAPNNAVENV